jgi:pSer/pThr/pTyr-binding forkhead associated (FHA) protein
VQFKLEITGPYESKTATVDGELSIGRTDQASVPIDDTGLSRVNTTFFIDDGELLVADENSTNGTFVNGERVTRPRVLRPGDEIKIGSSTVIRLISDQPISAPQKTEVSEPAKTPPAQAPTPANQEPQDETDNSKTILIAAGGLTVLIVFFTIIGIVVVSQQPTPNGNGIAGPPKIDSGLAIPVRVIDPLGAEDENDINDLMASWEAAEDEIVATNVEDITGVSPESEEAYLNVPASLLAEQQRKALEGRPPVHISPPGLVVPKELYGDGVIKQTRKLREMKSTGYIQPMDFAELAEKRLSRELIEMPMATQTFYLDVGGSAQDKPFSSFSFSEGINDIVRGTPKYAVLSKLAENFAGQKYDLENPVHRKQMRMRLLRMFQPRAKPILEELAAAYNQKFGRPLRVTSLTRSMDYQKLLNAGNANSYKVTGEGSLPPHTSGCAFDLARKHMPVEEQNFFMAKLAEMERAGKLDALIEYGANACFHIFIYHDGNQPK